MTNDERKLRTAIGAAIADLNKARRELMDYYYALPEYARGGKLLEAGNRMHFATKRLAKAVGKKL